MNVINLLEDGINLGMKLAGDYARGNKVNHLKKIIQTALSSLNCEYDVKPSQIMRMLENKGYSFFYGDEGTYVNPYTFRKVFYNVKKEKVKPDVLQDLAVIGLYKLTHKPFKNVKNLVYVDSNDYARGLSVDGNFNRRGVEYTGAEILDLEKMIKRVNLNDEKQLDDYLVVFVSDGLNYSAEDVKGILAKLGINYDEELLDKKYAKLKGGNALSLNDINLIRKSVNLSELGEAYNNVAEDLVIKKTVFDMLNANIIRPEDITKNFKEIFTEYLVIPDDNKVPFEDFLEQ